MADVRTVAFLTVVALLAGGSATAQTVNRPNGIGVEWMFADAVGYGGLGFAGGLFSAWDMEPGAGAALVAAATAAGALAGLAVWRGAHATARRGQVIGPLHRTAVLAGGPLAGGALGGLVAAVLINGEGEGTSLGSDEETVTALALAGAALGTWFAIAHEGEVRSRAVRVGPVRGGSGGYGLTVRIGF